MNTTTPSSRFAKFLSQFTFMVENVDTSKGDGMNRVRWTGKVGYVELGSISCCVARIELSEQGYQGNYSAFEVEIIHRVNGKLDSLTVAFHDALDPADRSDNRGKDHKGFWGWAANGGEIGWYIATPTANNVKNVDKAVNEYLKMWQGSDLFGRR